MDNARDKRSLQSIARFVFAHKHVRPECAHRTAVPSIPTRMSIVEADWRLQIWRMTTNNMTASLSVEDNKYLTCRTSCTTRRLTNNCNHTRMSRMLRIHQDYHSHYHHAHAVEMKKVMISSSRPMDGSACILEMHRRYSGSPFDEVTSRRARCRSCAGVRLLTALLPTTEH